MVFAFPPETLCRWSMASRHSQRSCLHLGGLDSVVSIIITSTIVTPPALHSHHITLSVRFNKPFTFISSTLNPSFSEATASYLLSNLVSRNAFSAQLLQFYSIFCVSLMRGWSYSPYDATVIIAPNPFKYNGNR